MKVKQLIAELQKCDPDLPVRVINSDVDAVDIDCIDTGEGTAPDEDEELYFAIFINQ